jgi:hypothetical protein
MLVVAAMPYVSLYEISRRKGIAAFDELDTLRKSLIAGRREEKMNMIRHDGETVQLILALLAISEECFQKELSVRLFLEVTKLEEC